MPVTIVGNNTPTAGGVGYGDGTNLAFTAAGTSGQVLQSNGASARGILFFKVDHAYRT